MLAIQVRNPGPAVRSNALELAVLHPVPVITAISPGFEIVRVEVDAPPMELVVDGLGFEEDAVITVDSTPVPTEFSSSRRLVGAVPPDLLATSGVRQVVVHNPEPSLAVSYAYPLFLTNPMPVLSSIEGSITFDPARSNEFTNVPIILNGSSFSKETTVWVSSPCTASGFRRVSTIRFSPTTLLATVSVQCGGIYQVQVRSNQPGGGVSATKSLIVAQVN